jgi:phosphopantothenoylcysteine decarboxylase/phosphopantothenate--cysteine ligase
LFRNLGYEFIQPDSGRLACGDEGLGKLPQPKIIVEKVMCELYDKKDLLGKKVLVTAGPTRANIDPVRFLSNRSTGKMGYAIAKEAKYRGAEVVLISGPTNEEDPYGVRVIDVVTNQEMFEVILKEFDDADIVIKSAAVADYKANEYSFQKIKKGDGDLEIRLVRDTDILMNLGQMKQKQILVGFAAESQNVVENARGKLKKKNLDYILANDITLEDTGFASPDNKVTIVTKKGEEISLDKMSKREVARNLFDFIFEKR